MNSQSKRALESYVKRYRGAKVTVDGATASVSVPQVGLIVRAISSDERDKAAALAAARKQRISEARAEVLESARKDYASIKPLLEDAPTSETRPVLQQFVKKYGDATIRVDTVVERVRVPEVARVQAVLNKGSARRGRTSAPAPVSTRTQAPARSQDKDARRILKLSDIRPETKSDFYWKKARQKRGNKRRALEDMLRKNKAKGETKAVMLLRLAENYMEEGQDIFRNEMETFQGEFDACFNSPNCDTEKMVANNDGSKRWRVKAIKIYQAILKGFPQFRRADEASFYLAIALQETGKPDDAAKRLARMVQDYPQSLNTPDAYVLLGEYYFENNNAYKALQAYKSASQHKSSSKYGFAMYKLAWCYYNVGEYGTAIDTMKSVVFYTMSAKSESQKALQEEALKDLVRFFADAGEMEEAYTYFTKLGKKDLIRAMLKRLADTYFEQGKFDQCIQTYRRLIAEDANSPKAPDYQNGIILAYQKIGRKRETRAEIVRLLETYGKNSGSGWGRANSEDTDAVSSAQTLIEKNLRTVALNYHNDAKKLGAGRAAKESYKLAGWGYSTYLKEFPDSQHSYEMRYAYGELLYKLKMYDKAYDQYMKVVAMDSQGKHTKFCAESAIFASEQMTKQEGAGSKPASKTEEAPLTDWETKLIAACDQWQELFPDHKNTRKIIFKSARLLYGKNHFKAASDRFRVVIGMDPKSKEAIEAANLILDSFVLVEDWVNLRHVSKAFYDQPGLGDARFKQDVKRIYDQAVLKAGQQ
jgi:tetratricopeptide (TPR) repeat protein